MTLNIDSHIPDGLLKLHDEFLNLAKQGRVVLNASDCRRIALQLVHEMALNPNYTVLPFPSSNKKIIPANSNNHDPKAA